MLPKTVGATGDILATLELLNFMARRLEPQPSNQHSANSFR
jgi:hypothetical protein